MTNGLVKTIDPVYNRLRPFCDAQELAVVVAGAMGPAWPEMKNYRQ
jgi:hypothetical protein